MISGYMGKLLFVDLSSGKISEEELDEKMARQYLGGYGLGARIIYSRQKAGVDPLGPENTLGFVTGPFTGTAVPLAPFLAKTTHDAAFPLFQRSFIEVAFILSALTCDACTETE